jgi:hypothetical protein
VHLFGDPGKIHIYSSLTRISFKCSKKSISVFYADPFFVSFNSRFCSPENSMLLPCCAASRLSKRPTALSINSSTGVRPLLPRGNSASKFQGLEVLSFQDSLRATPTKEYQGDVIANSTPYAQLPTVAPTRARIFFCSQVTCFIRDLSHHIETPM